MNQRLTIEDNGSGEILWDNTVNETCAIIKHNKPVYVDLKTINVSEDEQHFFRRLHCSILTECSEILEKAGLNQLFDLERIELSELKIAILVMIIIFYIKYRKNWTSSLMTERRYF